MSYEPQVYKGEDKAGWSDEEWESWIREVDPVRAILERAQRIHAFAQTCPRCQGGSHFSEFMLDRFGMEKRTASYWRAIGAKLGDIISQFPSVEFAADYRGIHDFITAPAELQQRVAAMDEPIGQGVIKQAKQELRAEQVDEARRSIPTETPEGQYSTIVLDPPWRYDGGEQAHDPQGFRGVTPYPTMGLDEIAALELPMAADCAVWLWTTHRFMRHTFALFDAWGLEDKAILTWVKPKMGIGRWLRSQSEYCVLGVRGRPVWNLTNQTTILEAPTREHSRKPDEFYAMVEQLCVGPYLDFFSREPREGWAQYGAETDRFDASA